MAIDFVMPSSKWHASAFIHPRAQVDRDCEVGARSRVWQFASVIRNATLGEDCSIATCSIVDGSSLGHNVIVSHGAFIDPGMKIGCDVFIGPHVALCNDAWPRVGKEGWFDPGALIKGDIVVTIIEDGASIGANATLMPGVRVGKGAMVAANAFVDRDVPDDHLFKRDGRIARIDPEHPVRRMRVAT